MPEILDLIIKYKRKKLESLILKGKTYDKILEESQKLDKYINRKMFKEISDG